MNQEYKYVESLFLGHVCYTFVMKAKDLLPIQYVAVRGDSTEQGAVQRVLNKRRINDIKDFVLQGNSFVNSFVLQKPVIYGSSAYNGYILFIRVFIFFPTRIISNPFIKGFY